MLMATTLCDGQHTTAMWVRCDTCVSCRLIEALIRLLIATTQSRRRQHVVTWMWCDTCVSCRLIEEWIQVLEPT